MARATADGAKVRVECEAGVFYLRPHEARKLAAEIGAAADDLFGSGSSAPRHAYDQAIAEHQAWQTRMDAELKGDAEC